MSEIKAGDIFKSFWIAGFESACHINISGDRLDMIASIQHDRQVKNDFNLLKTQGIHVAREGLRWPLIERGRRFDFSSVAPFVRAANQEGIQIIWTLCHYGWPDDVDVLAADFPDRMARYATECARYIADHSEEAPLYTPINEMSFLTWAICCTDVIHPFARAAHGRDHYLKRQFVRASIACCEAIWQIDPRARIVTVDPLIHVIPPAGRDDLADAARQARDAQFETWDILTGKIEPELGGQPKYAGVMGVNYYHDNQWVHATGERLHWHLRDSRRQPLHRLLGEVYERYQLPLFIGETSHIGSGRGEWIEDIADEVVTTLAKGIPFEGICLYPILDRHDWNNPDHWHNSGLWDLIKDDNGDYRRVLNASYADGLKRAQQKLAPVFGAYSTSTRPLRGRYG